MKWACALTLAAAVALVAGCTGSGPAPSSLPTISQSSVQPTADTAVTPSVVASIDVSAQVRAASLRYFSVASRALATGDTTELESLSTAGCPCRTLVKEIKRIYDGGSFRGKGYGHVDVRVHDVSSSAASAEVKAVAYPYDELDANGHVVTHSQGGFSHNDFSFVRNPNGDWIIGYSVNLS